MAKRVSFAIEIHYYTFEYEKEPYDPSFADSIRLKHQKEQLKKRKIFNIKRIRILINNRIKMQKKYYKSTDEIIFC